MSLQCNNSGDPTPSIIWIKDGKQLKTGGRLFVDRISGRLEVSDVKQKDKGEYMCRAINELGATSYTVTVNVRGEGIGKLQLCVEVHAASLWLMQMLHTLAYVHSLSHDER